jgi:integrase
VKATRRRSRPERSHRHEAELKWDTSWRALRDAAGLHGLRFHDLRHTVITELAEMGVADHVLESITRHLSRRMLEHYSHIRIDAKRPTRWT